MFENDAFIQALSAGFKIILSGFAKMFGIKTNTQVPAQQQAQAPAQDAPAQQSPSDATTETPASNDNTQAPAQETPAQDTTPAQTTTDTPAKTTTETPAQTSTVEQQSAKAGKNGDTVLGGTTVSTSLHKTVAQEYEKYYPLVMGRLQNVKRLFIQEYTGQDTQVYTYPSGVNTQDLVDDTNDFIQHVGAQKWFLGFPVDVTNINGIMLYNIAFYQYSDKTDDETQPQTKQLFNGNMQFARMYILDQVCGFESAREAWHLMFCFEKVLQYGRTAGKKGTYVYDDGTLQLSGSFKGIVKHIYKNIAEKEYTDFSTFVSQLDTQIKSQLKTKTETIIYTHSLPHCLRDYTQDQHNMKIAAMNFYTLIQSSTDVQVLSQNINIQALNGGNIQNISIALTGQQYSSTTILTTKDTVKALEDKYTSDKPSMQNAKAKIKTTLDPTDYMYNLNYADAKYLFEKFYPGQDYETALKDGTLLMWCSKTTPLTGADKSVRKETVLKEELKQNDPEKYTCPSFKVTTKKVSAV